MANSTQSDEKQNSHTRNISQLFLVYFAEVLILTTIVINLQRVLSININSNQGRCFVCLKTGHF